MTRKITLGLLLVLLVLIGAYYVYQKDNFNVQDDVEHTSISNVIDENVASDYANLVDEMYKMDQFISTQMERTTDYLELDDHIHERPIDIKDLQEEVFNIFYAAIKNQNLDLFTMVFSGDAIQELWGDEKAPDKRISLLENSMKKFSRNGQLQTVHYQLNINISNQRNIDGEMFLSYSDNVEITIPVTLSLIGDQEHAIYEFRNSILEIQNEIEKY